uniref:Uncharacterized protein n=1 Tax=Branchiostoma floridae TaxID=7739 RepID=C3YFX5_BRAFL|eukprot:XP_002604770.1 hypothetical protein BRAFLDRAFT_70619 [Branchiostoma floridae]
MATNSTDRDSPPNYVSIKVTRKGGGVVVNWYAIDCGQGDVTFAQLYEKLVAASEFRPVNFSDILSRTAHVQYFRNEEKVGRGVEVYAGLKVGHACRQFGCFVRIEVDKTASGKTDEDPRPKSAFEVMMTASREQSRETFMFPAYAGSGNAENNNPMGHIRLYNDIVDILKKHNFRFERNKGNEVSSKEVLTAVRNAVWYVLPHLKTLADRTIYLPQELRSLYDDKTFKQTYNNPLLYRHTLKPMSGKELHDHAKELFKVCCVPLLQKPHLKKVKDMVVTLGVGMSEYSEHLEKSNRKVQEQRKQLFPVRSVQDGNSSELRVVEAKVRHDPKIINRYCQLEQHLADTEEYKRALTTAQKKDLDSLKEDSMYTCGVSWIPDDHPLRESCYVSRALSCAVPVEPYYYSARLKAPAALRSILPLVCWQCGEEETLPIPLEKAKQFQTIHPVCQVCKSAGVEERTRGKKKLKRRREAEDDN